MCTSAMALNLSFAGFRSVAVPIFAPRNVTFVWSVTPSAAGNAMITSVPGWLSFLIGCHTNTLREAAGTAHIHGQQLLPVVACGAWVE